MSNTERKPIGGYLELELPAQHEHYHNGALRFNSGRSSLAYVLLRENPKRVYVPYFSCASILEPLDFHKINYQFFQIDGNFEIVNPPVLQQDEKLLYINYFGLKTNYIEILVEKYSSSLIVDNTQDFFSLPDARTFTFYSPRKFFGVPDGGYLFSRFQNDTLTEYEHHVIQYSHLIGRIEHGAQAHFHEYQENERALSYQGIRRMSRFTERILASIDYAGAKATRERNFGFLHTELGDYNRLDIDTSSVRGPLCYPLWIKTNNLRAKLIEHLIFVPTYWIEVIGRVGASDLIERSFVEEILPLPIDQRYSGGDMERIIDIVRKAL